MASPALGPHAQQPSAAATVSGVLPGCRYLVFKRPWPSMMRTLAGNHERFEQTYFDMYRGYYFTGLPLPTATALCPAAESGQQPAAR